MRPMCFPDMFIDHGKPDAQYELARVTADHIVAQVFQALGYADEAAAPARA